MAQKHLRAARANGTALGTTKATTPSVPDNSVTDVESQGLAAIWIVRRVPVSLVVARHIAELQGLGEARP